MLSKQLEKKVCSVRLALYGAKSENIIELFRRYLALVAESRSERYELPATLDLNPQTKTLSLRGNVNGIRKAVRVAIEHTARERHQTQALLFLSNAFSGCEAVETLNRRKYEGHDDLCLNSGEVSFTEGRGVRRITIQEAVDTASPLRREEFVAQNRSAAGTFQNRQLEILSL